MGSRWLSRLWVAAALLLIVGGAWTVLYKLAEIDPVTQRVAPSLEESAAPTTAAWGVGDST